MKTNLNLNLGSANSLPPSLKHKNRNTSSTKNEKISKYFSNQSLNEGCSATLHNSNEVDSPYKKSQSKIKCEPINDDLSKDFSTPKPIKIQRKIENKMNKASKQSKSKTQSKASKSKSTLKKNPIFKTTEDNFGLFDVNPDHLQMALALSKSTYAIEYPESSKEKECELPNFLTPEKIPKGKTTLERYGFRSNKPKLYPELTREGNEVVRKNKNSKFRFITPTLKTRTNEERQAIIMSKISLVLNDKQISSKNFQEAQDVELCSNLLKNFERKKLFFMSNELRLQKGDEYYNRNLNMTLGISKCGCLLKKWEEIAGREKSPIRSENNIKQINNECYNKVETTSYIHSTEIEKIDFQINIQQQNKTLDNVHADSTSLSQVMSIDNSPKRDCITPDLFESESENEYYSMSPDVSENFSQSLLSPSKKQSQSYSRSNSLKLTKIDFKTDINEELLANEEITKIMENDSFFSKCSKIKKKSLRYSEDDDTEELYLGSLETEREVALNLTQTSPLKEVNVELNGASESEEVFIITQNSLSTSNNEKEMLFQSKYDNAEELCLSSTEIEKQCSSTDIQKSTSKENIVAATGEVVIRDKDLNSQSTKDELIVDLTLSSSNDSHYSFTSVFPKDKEYFQENSLKNKITEDSDNNFDMSPLYIKNSNIPLENKEVEDFPSGFANVTNSRSSLDCTAMLNVTDYINQLLSQEDCNNDADGRDDAKGWERNDSFNHSNDFKVNISDNDLTNDDDELPLSQESCSQESITVSDEELNYSSIHSKDSKCNKYFYSLSDDDAFQEREINENVSGVDIYTVHSALKNKYRRKSATTPVHNRISELKTDSPSTSPLPPTLNNSLIELLGVPTNCTAKALEHEANHKVILNIPSETADNKYTAEKTVAANTENNHATPENNLIIKTKNITPLANYDEMDTPRIAKELDKFGLKPLKRQRGVKLLKYLYDCTHPLVEGNDIQESNSDEDEESRIIKKPKKSGGRKPRNSSDNCKFSQENIEIVGDALLKNENFDELIFERKYSVRILSCRIPLQIAWHNFLSTNSHIKENILLYEPLQLEVLHTMLKEQSGCKFHIQDLLAFFDKKCITIRTAQGSQRGKK